MSNSQSYTRRHTTRIENVVSTDGELLSTTEVGVNLLVKGTDEFTMLFRDNLASLLQLSGGDVKVYLWCAVRCDLNENQITLSRHKREEISTHTNMSIGSIDNSLSKLCKRGVMKKRATNEYMLTPLVSWKGNISEKTSKLKLYVDYTIQDPS